MLKVEDVINVKTDFGTLLKIILMVVKTALVIFMVLLIIKVAMFIMVSVLANVMLLEGIAINVCPNIGGCLKNVMDVSRAIVILEVL